MLTFGEDLEMTGYPTDDQRIKWDILWEGNLGVFIKSSKNHYFYCLGSSTSRYLPKGNNEKCVQRCVYVHRVFTIALILILNIWKPNKHPTIKN